MFIMEIFRKPKRPNMEHKILHNFFGLASLRKNVLIGQRPSEVLTPNVAVFNAILDFKLFFDLINKLKKLLETHPSSLKNCSNMKNIFNC